MSARQLALRYRAVRPRDGRDVPLHEDGRTLTYAQQMVGTDTVAVELRKGP